MNTTALIVWQSYLQSTPADRRGFLLNSISPELVHELQSHPAFMPDKQISFEAPEEELSRIHFSWLAPILRSLPENEIRLFLSSLDPKQITGLKASLLLSNTLPNLTSLGAAFLKKSLFEMIAKDDLLPIFCLPDDPLNGLIGLSEEELASLIDLLSMHDLSIEIRHIIETARLKEIYGLLTKAQTTFLKTLLHKREAVSFKKMGLTGWKGDREGLTSILLQRGINRIAKALYGKNSSLLWHVAHRLDVEKGQLLMKLCTALDHSRASVLLGEQVVELMNSLKNNNPPRHL